MTLRNCNSTGSLERRLAAYALAGGAMLASTETLDAGVIHGPQNVSIGVDQTYNLDLNNDGVTDFSFQNAPDSTLGLYDGRLLRVITPGINQVANFADPQSTGETTLDSQTFSRGPYTMAEYKVGTPPFNGSSGAWFGVSNMFLGLEFTIGNEIHYGWAELSVSGSTDLATAATATLIDSAFEGTPAGFVVPEANSLALLALGAAGVGTHLVHRRRKQKLAAPARA